MRDVRQPRSPAIRYSSAALVILAMFSSLGARCGTDPCSEGPGFDNALASVERWVRVISLAETPSGDGTVKVAFRVVDVANATTEGPPHPEAIAVHETFLPDIRDGLESDDDVYLMIASSDFVRPMVSTVMVRDTGGSHHFVGYCAFEGEQLLRQRLGDHYDAVLETLIGLTSRRDILSLLEV